MNPLNAKADKSIGRMLQKYKQIQRHVLSRTERHHGCFEITRLVQTSQRDIKDKSVDSVGAVEDTERSQPSKESEKQ